MAVAKLDRLRRLSIICLGVILAVLMGAFFAVAFDTFGAVGAGV